MKSRAGVSLGHGYTLRGEHIHFEGGGSTGAAGDNRCGTGGRYLFFVDVWHSTPITVYHEGDGLVAETILYERETRRSLAVVRADLTERGMEDIQISPPPGAEVADTVPAWQMEIFQREGLAKGLREKAQSYLP